MIRAALFAVLFALPASAATLADCRGLVGRVPLVADKIASVAGACVFSRVVIGQGPRSYRARQMILGGDIDALPDALPVRLTGGLIDLDTAPRTPGRPGLDGLRRAQRNSGINATFDLTSRDGVVRLNAFNLRLGEAGEIEATARVAGVPEVWPVDRAAMSAVTLQALDVRIEFDGLFEAVALLPLGAALLDLSAPAEPQIERLRGGARDVLSAYEDTPQSANAVQLQTFLDALPRPRGVLTVSLGGSGVGLAQIAPLLAGATSPDRLARLADTAQLDLTWVAEVP